MSSASSSSAFKMALFLLAHKLRTHTTAVIEEGVNLRRTKHTHMHMHTHCLVYELSFEYIASNNGARRVRLNKSPTKYTSQEGSGLFVADF